MREEPPESQLRVYETFQGDGKTRRFDLPFGINDYGKELGVYLKNKRQEAGPDFAVILLGHLGSVIYFQKGNTPAAGDHIVMGLF